ncbi:MAG: BamA/TamA family outer membrane protein [Winogradskyella sp.]|nr:BamA/TamA family outer membrane protein [Winogradskyella sp.]
MIGIFLYSCSAVKRLEANEHLLTENTIIANDKKVNNERINNLILQKPNAKIKIPLLLSLPLRLHIYNLARPNIDSIIQAKVLDNPEKVARKIKILSRKQLEKELQARRDFNAWLKRTGEAPVIYDEAKAERSATNLKKYYFSKGWFNNQVDFTVEKTDNKRAKVNYNVTLNQPYVLDSIKPFIATPAIDSLYQKFKKGATIKIGQQYDEENFAAERERLNTTFRNNGIFHFSQENIRFETDTINTDHKVKTDLIISNRVIRNEDSTIVVPFKAYKIKDVNIFTDYSYENRTQSITDTINYKGFTLYSIDKLKFRPKALTDAIFISKGKVYSDLDRTRTSRYLNDLQMFRYPSIQFVENEQDTTLTANIILEPRKKYGLSFDMDITQSNIQSIGFSFSTGLKIRNVFRGAETLELSAIGAIGSSKDKANPDDAFFDINEYGANARLTIPRLFFPINTERIIPKFMSPSTIINFSTTSQQNIGLDKQTLSSIFSYNWLPSRTVTNTLELFNVQFVKNLNIANYFGVYTNSFARLNTIAQNINYIGNDETLTFPAQAQQFINDVLSNNTSLSPTDDDFILVNNIEERKQRLTENNLIFSSSFDYKKDKRDNIFDNDFSIFKFRVEIAGNLLQNISRISGKSKNENGNYEVFGVAFSQYVKTEVDYVKYFSQGGNNVLAFRSYFGIAIPYGNSNSIPFAESFFAGGPNDNRAWTAYNLGPGSSQTTNEFNEANLKIHLSAEQRFNMFGNLRGALFIDAGNIWNVLDNVEDDAATFGGLDSLKDIAIGSGFGLRYDFRFFVLRGDIGFKTYDPSQPEGSRWFKKYNFSNAVYNIGINYPF